jgi:hypothetical protein
MQRLAKTRSVLLAALTTASMPAWAQMDKMDGKMMTPAMSQSEKMAMDSAMMGMTKSDKAMMSRAMMMAPGQRRVMMKTAPSAAAANLQAATGMADVDVARGMVEIAVTLPEGASLPAGTVLEGWLSTAGRKGGPGMSTASEADQKFGPAFGMADTAATSRDIPYALSTGLLRRVGNSRTYLGRFQIDNPLTPYAAVAVTLESDGNMGAYDPRPGTPLMDGMIAPAMMMGRDGRMGSAMMGARMMMMSPDGKMMPMTAGAMPEGGTMMMVMSDGARAEVQMQDGKMMMSMPDGSMAEVKAQGR